MNYDSPNAFYDSPEAFYDAPGAPVLNTKKTMKKPKLNLKGLTLLQKVQKADDIVESMTGNANYTTPNPTLVTVTAKSDAAAAAFSEREQAKQTCDEKQAALDAAEAELNLTLTALAAYVTNASGGVPEKILSAGMEVAGTPTPVGPMPQVLSLEAITNAAEGVVC